MIPRLGMGTVDLFFTSPPYADQRAYSRIHPDRYVEWFLPFAEAMHEATSETGRQPRAQHQEPGCEPGCTELAAPPVRLPSRPRSAGHGLALGLDIIWAKPNAVPGRFGPRPKDSFEYVYHFARGLRPHFDLDAVRVP
jgi:hypothetical protein